MTALSVLLDELEQARAKATPGEWVQHAGDGEYVIGDVSDGGDSYVDVADTYRYRQNGTADAVLIVAAVNALPTLVAALRRVEALADEIEGAYLPMSPAEGQAYDIANQIRAALNEDLS